jgi:hypothetical protein
MVRAGRSRCRIGEPDTGRSLKGDKTEALLILEFFVFFSEPFDTAGCIDQFLLAGKKWMAFGTNFHAYVFFRRTNLDGVAASTLNGCFEIIRMDVGFHCNFNPLYVF